MYRDRAKANTVTPSLTAVDDKNPYFISKSQDDIRKQKNFNAQLYRKRMKKLTEEKANNKKPKLTETELKEKRKARDKARYEKNKKFEKKIKQSCHF